AAPTGSASPQNQDNRSEGSEAGSSALFLRLVAVIEGTDSQAVISRARMNRDGEISSSRDINCSAPPALHVKSMLCTERSKVMSQVSASRSSARSPNLAWVTRR